MRKPRKRDWRLLNVLTLGWLHRRENRELAQRWAHQEATREGAIQEMMDLL